MFVADYALEWNFVWVIMKLHYHATYVPTCKSIGGINNYLEQNE